MGDGMVTVQEGYHMVTIPELSADYHRTDARRKSLEQRIRQMSRADISGRDLLLVEMDSVITTLYEIAARLAGIRTHDMNDLRAKATILLTMQDWETQDVLAFSFGVADDIVNLADRAAPP